MAAGDARIRFAGRVSDEKLLDLYANALVVPFVPVNEDYGLITIEAFKSKKPVITCTDSGEPTQFVKNFETGFVVDPDPRSIAAKLTYLADRPSEAAEMGRRGFNSISHISWESLICTMLEGVAPQAGAAARTSSTPAMSTNGQHKPAAEKPASETVTPPLKVTVLDMQPIDPPTGGGRMRLLGLYHALGANMLTTYVGTYDWPGPGYREHQLSPTLTEIDVPLSAEHFAAARALQEKAGGKNVIDVSFHNLVSHSPEFVETARRHAAAADVVIVSHPWVYPVVRGALRRDAQLVVYESHNVEGYLRATLLDDGALGSELVKEVVRVEYDLCHEADLVLACSHEDRQLFHDLYGIPFSKIEIAPNGTFVSQVAPVDEAERARLKEKLGLGKGPAALFIGSGYGPNQEAAEFIRDQVAPRLPEVTFVIAGDVGKDLTVKNSRNVVLTGRVDEQGKRDYLGAVDFALNPMFSGSGTNIKMFDFMAAGLPVVTTAIGARGIDQGPFKALRIVRKEAFVPTIRELMHAADTRKELGLAARQVVEQKYSWERISAGLGKLLARLHTQRQQRTPRFSVIVPSYERPERLTALVESLRLQSFQDFEVIIVDQSAKPWRAGDVASGLNIQYIHTDVKGAVSARNTGAVFARGEILAFTDDDCVPLFNWLESATKYFEDPSVAALEGIIMSDKYNDPDFRAVTNIGMNGEGFMTEGFMTANFFIRREIFNRINGFDDAFDHPHFREDTDLGWRAQAHGRIPFAHDVCVYHPPQTRQLAREGVAERNRFFEKDALLLKKHPDRYRSLFMKEAHYAQTPGFREHFLRGADKYEVVIDDYIRSFLTR